MKSKWWRLGCSWLEDEPYLNESPESDFSEEETFEEISRVCRPLFVVRHFNWDLLGPNFCIFQSELNLVALALSAKCRPAHEDRSSESQ